MRVVSLIGGWVMVVLVTTAITWQIVGAAGAQVSEQPASPLNVSAPEFNQSSTTTAPGAAPSISDPGQTTTTTSPTTTTTGSPTTTSTDPSPTTTSVSPTTTVASTTSTSQPATTTTTETGWSLTTRNTSGGTVVIAYRPGEVMLQAATPAPGFQTEVKSAGPPEVEVEFESETEKVEIRAEWENDQLEIEVSTESRDE